MWACRSTSARHAICLLAVCFFVDVSWSGQAPGAATATVPSLNRDGKETPERLRFVRAFSSAQDVKREHPVLDRTLDIIAGPKTGQAPVDALEAPYAVTTDSLHRVFVADVRERKVAVFDFDHSKYSVLKDGGDRLRRPVGVATDREGNVYVTDSESGAILVYDARGKFRRYLKQSNGREAYFEAPWGLAIDPATEHIYVCDSHRHMVIVLDKKGRVLNRFGKRSGGTQEGEFRFPTQLVVVGDEIVVLDSGNHRLQVLDLRGHFRREINLPGADNRSGLAMDGDGNIYVSDPEVNHIYVFNHDGRMLYVFGQMGTKAGMFNGASGMWVDSGRSLYVVDAQNRRVQIFQIQRPTPNGGH